MLGFALHVSLRPISGARANLARVLCEAWHIRSCAGDGSTREGVCPDGGCRVGGTGSAWSSADPDGRTLTCLFHQRTVSSAWGDSRPGAEDDRHRGTAREGV